MKSEKTSRSTVTFFDRHPVMLTLLLLYVPIILFILPQIISHGYLFKGDVAFDFAPLTYAGLQQWRGGEIPLWTPLMQCGFPLLGEGMGALLYPPLLMLSFIVPVAAAFFVDCALHLIIAPAVMYRYCRSIGLGRDASVLGTWIWIIAGPFLGYLGSPAVHGITWFPLFFMMVDRMFLPRRALSAITLYAVFFGLLWTGGLPQNPVYSTMAVFLYLLYRLWEKKSTLRMMITVSGYWIIAVALGTGLGAVQVLPTLEVGSESIRAGGIDYTFASFGSLFPAGFAGFILPSWTRLAGYWISGPNLFAGFTALALVLFTLRKKPDNRVVHFFWLLLACGCFLSLGKFNPLYRFLYVLPGLHFLRVPSRFMLFAQFSLSVLAAFGLEGLGAKGESASVLSVRETLRRSIAAFTLPIFCMAAGNLLFALSRKPLFAYAQRYVDRAVGGNAYAVQQASFYYGRIVALFNDVAAVLSPLQYSWAVSTAAGAAGVAVFWLWSRGRFRYGLQKTVLALCCAALTQFVPNPVTMLRDNDAPEPPIARYLKRQDGRFRIYNVNSAGNILGGAMSQERLDPDYNLFHGIENAGVYSSLGSLRYYRFMGRLSTANLAFGITAVNDTILREEKRLLDFLNVRYCTAGRELAVDGLKKVPVEGGSMLYENTTVLPRALVVPQCSVIPDTALLLRRLHSAAFEPTREVFLEETPGDMPENGIASVPVITAYKNRSVEIDAQGPGWLVVSDLYYPGWHAALDEKKVNIYRANYTFRAVALPSGNHHITFTYAPDSFAKGWRLSLLSLTAIVALAVYGAVRKRRSGSD